MDDLILEPVADVQASTAVALLDKPLTAVAVFSTVGGVDDVLEKLKNAARAEPRDISTDKGRKAIASLALKIASSKVALDNLGKDLVSELKRQTGAIDAERRRIRDDLDDLKVEIRKPLTDWEDREKARIDGFESAIAGINGWALVDDITTDEELRERIGILENAKERDWQEFEDRAYGAIGRAISAMQDTLSERAKAAAERAEAERLAAEEAERQRVENERLQREREARIAAEAAERAKREAEERAALEAAAAAEAARLEQERVEREKREAIERAEREAAAAAEAAKREQARVERERRDAVERAEAAERERVRQAEEAEAQREAAAREAERQKQAAVEAERNRIEAEQAAQAAAAEERAKKIEHVRKFNREIVAALGEKAKLSLQVAQVVVAAIAKGEIPHTAIAY